MSSIIELTRVSEYQAQQPQAALYRFSYVAGGTIKTVKSAFNIEDRPGFHGLCTSSAPQPKSIRYTTSSSKKSKTTSAKVPDVKEKEKEDDGKEKKKKEKGDQETPSSSNTSRTSEKQNSEGEEEADDEEGEDAEGEDAEGDEEADEDDGDNSTPVMSPEKRPKKKEKKHRGVNITNNIYNGRQGQGQGQDGAVPHKHMHFKIGNVTTKDSDKDRDKQKATDIFRAVYEIRDGDDDVVTDMQLQKMDTDIDHIFVEVEYTRLYLLIRDRIKIHVSGSFASRICRNINMWFDQDWQIALLTIRAMNEAFVSPVYFVSPSTRITYSCSIMAPMPELGRHYRALFHNGSASSFISALANYMSRAVSRYTRMEQENLLRSC